MIALFVNEVNAQDNTILNTNSSSPSWRNVLIGVNAGSNLTTQTSPVLRNHENVFVGFAAGQNSNSVAGDLYECYGNTFVGANSGYGNTFGKQNVFLGYRSGYYNTTGSENVMVKSMYNSSGNIMTGTGNTTIGIGTGDKFKTGNYNCLFGYSAGLAITDGNYNLLMGYNAGKNIVIGSDNICLGSGANQNSNLQAPSNTAYENIYIGKLAAQNNTGVRNTIIGFLSGGDYLTTGNFNTFLGCVLIPNAVSNPTSAGNNTSNTIILADGGSNQRLYIHSNGNTGIGLGNNVIPVNKLDVKGGTVIGTNYTASLSPAIVGVVAPTDGLLVEGKVGIGNTAPNNKVEITTPPIDALGRSGLRFTNLTNAKTTSANPLKKVLSVNGSGDVVLVDDIGSNGLIQNCSTTGFVPVNSSTIGTLNCSQIFDNGVGVGVGYTTIPTDPTFFNYNFNSSFYTNYTGAYANGTGAIKFHVNGNARANGIWTTSDKKFKKDIKPIENALSIVEKIHGKTYLWDREAFKDKNFDAGGHSGFIAQELEKVLPHLVATGENGDKAVNYMELMPYLVEAMKEQQKLIVDQQSQIDELKNQITNTFKSQNQDLIQLENTKIISVSPNPSNDVISVSLNIEKSVQMAILNVYDLNGKLLSSLIINDRNTNITKTLQKDNFGNGVYVVSLIVNGKSIDSKKIVFN